MRIVRGHLAGAPSEQRSATFTGSVWADPVVPTAEGTTVTNVFFTPGARTFWHHHERGQVLFVTMGTGLICVEGERPRVLEPGDVVQVPPGEHHWHGGSAICCMQHLAISLGRTTWLGPVADEEYAATPVERVEDPGRPDVGRSEADS